MILQVAGRTVQNGFDVQRALWSCKAGDKVQARALRAGREVTVSLTLAEPETATQAVRLPRSPAWETTSSPPSCDH